MTLVDTPGFNDPNKTRSDKHIHIEFVNTVRETLKSAHEGISVFVQCIMPDQSDRIRQSVIKTMMNFLLMLSVFNRDTTVEDILRCHPKMAIVFNHVSKYIDFKRTLERIDKYKDLLFEDAITFYCIFISDETEVAN